MKWKNLASRRAVCRVKLAYSGYGNTTAPGELAMAKLEPHCSVPHSRHRAVPTSFSISS